MQKCDHDISLATHESFTQKATHVMKAWHKPFFACLFVTFLDAQNAWALSAPQKYTWAHNCTLILWT